jgi:hypothetical protein
MSDDKRDKKLPVPYHKTETTPTAVDRVHSPVSNQTLLGRFASGFVARLNRHTIERNIEEVRAHTEYAKARGEYADICTEAERKIEDYLKHRNDIIADDHEQYLEQREANRIERADAREEREHQRQLTRERRQQELNQARFASATTRFGLDMFNQTLPHRQEELEQKAKTGTLDAELDMLMRVTAGFLVSAYSHILRQNTKPADLKRNIVDGSLLKPAQWKFLEEHAFTGYDNDANMVKIAILNLYLHQLEKAHIELRNPLTTGFGGVYPGQRYDVILANPPFAGKVQEDGILADLNYKLNTRATELLFLKWFIDHLTPNGRAGVIVPNGVLFGSTKAAKYLRELLLTECDLQAVINLPSGVFKPYSGVGTAALVFQKGTPTKSVWFYDVTADGFSLDDKRTAIGANDIPDVLVKWPGREEGSNSYQVSIEKIRENDWSLAAGRYKPVTTQAKNHDAPAQVLSEVIELEQEILQRADALMKQIKL